jgi:hypothetical protein
LEHNIRTFNLSSAIEAFHFATFLLQLREYNEELDKLFGQKRNALFKNHDGKTRPWTKEAQGNSLKGELESSLAGALARTNIS